MKLSCDLAVVGAGTAGIIAAMAAADKGADVVLIEASTRLGGMAIYGLHQFICGLFCSDGAASVSFLHGETTRAFCRSLVGGEPQDHAVQRGRVWLLPFGGGEHFETCAEREMGSRKNIRVLRGSPVVGAECEGGRLVRIKLSPDISVQVGAAVDCTGSAELCRLSGAEMVRPERRAMAGYGFQVANVGVPAQGLSLALAVPYMLRTCADQKQIPPHLAFTTWESSTHGGQGWIKMALPESECAHAQEQAQTVWEFLQKNSPPFQNAEFIRFLEKPLPRETVHLVGAATLTEEDVLGSRDFPDAVAHNCWPIEHWEEGRGVVFRYPRTDKPHGIPLRCLRPQNGPENWLCAGAAISATPLASASIRNMGTCMATGEAAAKHLLEK